MFTRTRCFALFSRNARAARLLLVGLRALDFLRARERPRPAAPIILVRQAHARLWMLAVSKRSPNEQKFLVCRQCHSVDTKTFTFCCVARKRRSRVSAGERVRTAIHRCVGVALRLHHVMRTIRCTTFGSPSQLLCRISAVSPGARCAGFVALRVCCCGRGRD